MKNKFYKALAISMACMTAVSPVGAAGLEGNAAVQMQEAREQEDTAQELPLMEGATGTEATAEAPEEIQARETADAPEETRTEDAAEAVGGVQSMEEPNESIQSEALQEVQENQEIQAMAGDVDTDWYTADPSRTEFEISTAAQLRGLSQLVYNTQTNQQTTDFANCVIRLTNDIDLENQSFAPIGTGSTEKGASGKISAIGFPFRGVFDGNGNTIRGLEIVGEKRSAARCQAGLFGCIEGYQPNGTLVMNEAAPEVTELAQCGVRNLTVEHVYISQTYSGRANQAFGYIGGLVGRGNAIFLENCHVKDVAVNTNYNYVGGLFGQMDGATVNNCTVTNAEILCTEKEDDEGNTYQPQSWSYAGILGGKIEKNYKTLVEKDNAVANVTVQGAVIGTSAIGGLLGGVTAGGEGTYIEKALVQANSSIEGKDNVGGIAGSGMCPIKDSGNCGEVIGTGKNVSGIATARGTRSSYENCVNEGRVVGQSFVAGIASVDAKAKNVDRVTIRQCANRGTIQVTGADAKAESIASMGTEKTEEVATFDITGSYSLGAVKNASGEDLAPFTANNQYNNVYYDSAAYGQIAIDGLKAASTEQFKDRTVVNALNEGLEDTAWYQNVNYPDNAAHMTLVQEITADGLEILVGKTARLQAKALPEEASNPAVSYSSQNPAVATVDGSGTVTGVKAGATEISIMALDGASVEKKVSVKVKEETKTPSPAVTKKSIGALSVAKIGNKAHTGKVIKPSVTVKDGKKTLKANTDYTLAYANNKNPGTATVTITGKGSYTGSRKVTFQIVAAKGKIYANGKNRYKITNASATKGTASYAGMTDKKATKITVPSTVRIGAVTYKVTAIENSAFKDYKKLKSVVVGSNVTSIGGKAFQGCGKLTQVTVKTAKLRKVGAKALQGVHKKAVVKVPSAKLAAYKKLFKGKGQKATVKIQK